MVRNINTGRGHHFHQHCEALFHSPKMIQRQIHVGTPHTAEESSVLDAVREDPEMSTRSLATILGRTYPTVFSRLQSGCRKVLTRWIPNAFIYPAAYPGIHINFFFSSRTVRSKTWLLEIRGGSFKILTRTVPCGFRVEVARQIGDSS